MSKAALSDIPKPAPPRAILPPPGHSPVRKFRSKQRHFPTQTRHSLSLDTLSNLNNNSERQPDQTTEIYGRQADKSKCKKRSKKKRASSHSISPQRVAREAPRRHSPDKPVKILANQTRDSNGPLKQSDTVLCTDRIIKRAISNLMSRSATLSHPDTLTPYSTTSMLKLAPSPPKHCQSPSRPIRTSPHKNRNLFFRPNTGFPAPKFENLKIPPFPLTNHKRRIFLSDTQNPGMTGSTSGRIPPLNSPISVSHSIELVPSLGDIRSQVSLKKELRALESKRQISTRAEIERERAISEKRAEEERMRAKEKFRAQIYALNSVMRDLEQEKFLEAQSAKV